MGASGLWLSLGSQYLKQSVLFSGQGHQGPDVPGQLSMGGIPVTSAHPRLSHHQSGLRDMLISVGVHSLS